MAKWMCVVCLLAPGVAVARPAAAQELEPGAYAVAPKGLNVFVLANTFSFGDLAFDPAGPISDASARINATSAGLAHMTSLFGRSAQLSVGVPIVAGHLEGIYVGEAAEVTRVGLGDPRVRVGVNLYGAPAMDRKTFTTYRQRRLIGASLTASIPIGRYSQDRLINIGAHRWALKPELAFVSTVGKWTLEVFGGAWFFSRNDEFYRGSVRTQAPLGSLQFHVDYLVKPRLQVSGNMNFYAGGRTTVNGTQNLDLQRNSRVGLTVKQMLSGGRTLRYAISRGAYTTIGADFVALSFSFQQAW
jgi:hypothetical protein